MTRRFVDLHTHSNASDGSMSPAQVVQLADEANLAAVALCDHDTLDGLAEAQRASQHYPKLTFINGIEVSAVFPRGTLHILGLDIDSQAQSINVLARDLRGARDQRNPRIIEALQAMGVDITMEEVLAQLPDAHTRSNPVVGRMHIAQALCLKGYARSIDDAFAKYLAKGRGAFVDKERMSPSDAIAAIRDANGIAVLAHPCHLLCDNYSQLERIVKNLRAVGLGGIEVYHSDHSPEQIRQYLNLARRLELAISGGSDFHGSGKPHVSIGRPRTPLSAVMGILKRR